MRDSVHCGTRDIRAQSMGVPQSESAVGSGNRRAEAEAKTEKRALASLLSNRTMMAPPK